MKLSTLSPGSNVLAGYIRNDRRFFTETTFQGVRYGSRITGEKSEMLRSVKELKEALGVKNLTSMEDLLIQNRQTAYAVFQDEDGLRWSAYYWEGAWRVGSSGDRLRLITSNNV